MRSLKISGWLEAVFRFGVALLAWCAIAHAHTHLLGSVPADGGVVATPPSTVVLTFSEAARLTAAWIQKGEGARSRLTPPDRKSTRLNSSHEWISYAVFCLKKKNR